MAVKTKLYTAETIGLMVFSASLGAGAMYFYNKKKNGLSDYNMNYGQGILMPGPAMPRPPGPPNYSPVFDPMGNKRRRIDPRDLENDPYADLKYKDSPGADKAGGVNR